MEGATKSVGRGAPGRRRVPRPDREEQMVQAAAAVFAERGYHASSMDEIAAAAGISKPMLYSYFGSKAGLFLACTRRGDEELRRRVRAAALAPGLPPDERMWRGLIAVFTFVEENEETWRVMYPPEGRMPDPALEAGALKAQDAMGSLMEELVVRVAQEQGVSRDAAALSAPMGHAFTAATLAVVRWWLAHPGEPKELQALRLMNFAWRGFGNMLAGELWLPR